MKIFPFQEENDSRPTASGNSVNCARSQKNMMKKGTDIQKRRRRVQSQLLCKGSKSARKRKKNKKCIRHKLTCKASSVGPLTQTMSIGSLQQRDFLSSSNCPPINIYFLSKLSRGGFQKRRKGKQLPVVFTGFPVSSGSRRSA